MFDFRNDDAYCGSTVILQAPCNRIGKVVELFSNSLNVLFRFIADIRVITESSRYRGRRYPEVSSDIYYSCVFWKMFHFVQSLPQTFVIYK